MTYSHSNDPMSKVSYVLAKKIRNITKSFDHVKKLLTRNKMPTFFMFSTLDKNLLKYMLFRATELEDQEIE
jgi:hypothetical protein